MKRLFFSLIFLALFLTLSPLFSQDFTQSYSSNNSILKDRQAAQALSLQVVSLFSQEKIEKAVSTMRAYWPIPNEEIDRVQEQTIGQMKLLNSRFGKMLGINKIKEESVQDFALREVYFIRYEKSALRLIFIYYHNQDGWIINSFSWDDSFVKEF